MHANHVVELAAGIYQVYPLWMNLKELKHVEVTYSLIKWRFSNIWGHAVAQLVKALRYKVVGSIPDGVIGIFHWLSPSGRSPGVDWAFNRNEYQENFLGDKGGRCVGLTTLPPSCPDCHEMWELQPPGNLRACTWISFNNVWVYLSVFDIRCEFFHIHWSKAEPVSILITPLHVTIIHSASVNSLSPNLSHIPNHWTKYWFNFN